MFFEGLVFSQDLPKIGELEKYKHQVDNWVTTYIEKTYHNTVNCIQTGILIHCSELYHQFMHRTFVKIR